MKSLLLLLIFFSFSAFSKPHGNLKPRKDLYKKITNNYGVSLKEVYQVLFVKNKINFKRRLINISSDKRMGDVINVINEEISLKAKECDLQRRNPYCEKQVLDLKKQKAFLTDLENKIKKNPQLVLYKSLVILSYLVRHEVLSTEYKKWKIKCGKQGLINSLSCKQMFYEIDILYAILRDLTQESYTSAVYNKQFINKEKIKKLVDRYE